MPSLPDLLDEDLPLNVPAQSDTATAASGFKQEAASSQQEAGQAPAAADIKQEAGSSQQEAASSQQEAGQPQAAAGIKQEPASSQQKGARGQAAQGQSAGPALPPLPRLSAQGTAVPAPGYMSEQAGIGLNARSGPAAAASAAAVPAAAAAGSGGIAPLPWSRPLPAVGTPAGSYAAGPTPAPASLSCQALGSSQTAARWMPAGSGAMPTQRQGQCPAPDRGPQKASQQQWRPQAPAWAGTPGSLPYQQPPAMSVTPASGGRGTQARPWGVLQTPSQQGLQRPAAPYGAGAGFGGLGMGRLGVQGMRTVTRVSWPRCRACFGGAGHGQAGHAQHADVCMGELALLQDCLGGLGKVSSPCEGQARLAGRMDSHTGEGFLTSGRQAGIGQQLCPGGHILAAERQLVLSWTPATL